MLLHVSADQTPPRRPSAVFRITRASIGLGAAAVIVGAGWATISEDVVAPIAITAVGLVLVLAGTAVRLATRSVRTGAERVIRAVLFALVTGFLLFGVTGWMYLQIGYDLANDDNPIWIPPEWGQLLGMIGAAFLVAALGLRIGARRVLASHHDPDH